MNHICTNFNRWISHTLFKPVTIGGLKRDDGSHYLHKFFTFFLPSFSCYESLVSTRLAYNVSVYHRFNCWKIIVELFLQHYCNDTSTFLYIFPYMNGEQCTTLNDECQNVACMKFLIHEEQSIYDVYTIYIYMYVYYRGFAALIWSIFCPGVLVYILHRYVCKLLRNCLSVHLLITIQNVKRARARASESEKESCALSSICWRQLLMMIL